MNVVTPYIRTTIETLLKKGVGQREIARKLGVNRETIRKIGRRIGESKSPTWPPAFIGENGQSAPLTTEVTTRFCEGLAAKTPAPATGSDTETDQNVPPWPPAFIGVLAPSGVENPTPAVASTSITASAVSVSPAAPSVAAAVMAQRCLSACEPHREWIEAQVRLGRNAVSIYQDLVDRFGFDHKYNAVKRFVGKLKAMGAPERFDVLEFPPGEEAQVDYGQGAPTLTDKGKYKKPWLFVMTLKYSGKSFRKVVWKTGQDIWARLHEEAFRSFGGCPQYVVLDNLKEGVLKPDLYEPRLNPVYAAMLAHYGVIADTCRVRDPNRKGTVESAIQHTQNALKGRQFNTIDAQNDYLRHWEANWASTRIHGRKKRQVMEMFREEKPHLAPLPVEGFRLFKQVVRTVDEAGMVQVDGAYYTALPASLYSQVTVRVYEREIEILDRKTGTVFRHHAKAARKGTFVMANSDRIFNPSRQNAFLLHKVDQIGPHASTMAHTIFTKQGRIGAKVIYGISNLTNTYAAADIDEVCRHMMAQGMTSYAILKQALQKRIANHAKQSPSALPLLNLIQDDPQIRPVSEYQTFWDTHTQANTHATSHTGDNHHGHVNAGT